jgi:hypothetical protein
VKGEQISSSEHISSLGEVLVRICEMTDARLRAMSGPDRDRLLQLHLAAARGPRRNLSLLCEMTDAFTPVRRERLVQERGQ